MGRGGGGPDRRRVPSSHDRWAASPERTGRRRRRGRGGLGVAGRGGALMTDSRTRTSGPGLERAAEAVDRARARTRRPCAPDGPPHAPAPATLGRTPAAPPRHRSIGQGMVGRLGRAGRVDPGEPVVGLGPPPDRPGRHRDPARVRRAADPLAVVGHARDQRLRDRVAGHRRRARSDRGHHRVPSGGDTSSRSWAASYWSRSSASRWGSGSLDHDPSMWSPSTVGRASRSRRDPWPSRSSSASVWCTPWSSPGDPGRSPRPSSPRRSPSTSSPACTWPWTIPSMSSSAWPWPSPSL